MATDVNGLTALTAIKADARQRSYRTAIQGLVATVLVAVLPLAYASFQGGLDKVNWSVLEWSAGTAAAMAAISYLMGVLKPPVVADGSVVPSVVVAVDPPAPVPDPVLQKFVNADLGDAAPAVPVVSADPVLDEAFLIHMLEQYLAQHNQ